MCVCVCGYTCVFFMRTCSHIHYSLFSLSARGRPVLNVKSMTLGATGTASCTNHLRVKGLTVNPLFECNHPEHLWRVRNFSVSPAFEVSSFRVDFEKTVNSGGDRFWIQVVGESSAFPSTLAGQYRREFLGLSQSSTLAAEKSE